MVSIPSNSTVSSAGAQNPRILSNLGSSFRQSYHSSTSSLGSMERGHEDSICALDINEMLGNLISEILSGNSVVKFEFHFSQWSARSRSFVSLADRSPF